MLKLLLIEMVSADHHALSYGEGESKTFPTEVSAVMDCIYQNLDKPLTATALADLAGFHPAYFNQYFKKHVGVTPAAYIAKCKMEFAQYLVCNTQKEIKEIASILGFSDQFVFSKKFRKFYGMSPTKMRKIRI